MSNVAVFYLFHFSLYEFKFLFHYFQFVFYNFYLYCINSINSIAIVYFYICDGYIIFICKVHVSVFICIVKFLFVIRDFLFVVFLKDCLFWVCYEKLHKFNFILE